MIISQRVGLGKLFSFLYNTCPSFICLYKQQAPITFGTEPNRNKKIWKKAKFPEGRDLLRMHLRQNIPRSQSWNRRCHSCNFLFIE